MGKNDISRTSGYKLDKELKPKLSKMGALVLTPNRDSPKTPKVRDGELPWIIQKKQYTEERKTSLQLLGINNLRNKYSKYQYILSHKTNLNLEQLSILLADQGAVFQNSFDRIAEVGFTADEFLSYSTIMKDIKCLDKIKLFLRKRGFIKSLNQLPNRRITKEVQSLLKEMLEDKNFDCKEKDSILNRLNEQIKISGSSKIIYRDLFKQISDAVSTQYKINAELKQELKKWSRINGYHQPYMKDFKDRKHTILEILHNELKCEPISYRIENQRLDNETAKIFYDIVEVHTNEDDKKIVKDISNVIYKYRCSYLADVCKEKLQNQSVHDIYELVLKCWFCLSKEKALHMLPFILYYSFTRTPGKDMKQKNIDFEIKNLYKMNGNKNFQTRKSERSIVELNIGLFERLLFFLKDLELNKDMLWRQFVYITGYFDQYHLIHTEVEITGVPPNISTSLNVSKKMIN